MDRPPHLSSTIYELVLATLLTEDPRALHHAIRTWPDSIYNRAHIVAAVEDALAKLPRRSSNPNLDNGSESDNDTQASYHRYLLEAAAELYTREQRMDMALDCLLRLRKPDVFDFITRHRLESQLAARVVLLLDFEEEEEARRRREGAASVAISPKKDGKPHVTSSPSSASSEGFAMRLLLDNIASMPVTDMVERLAKHPAYLCRYLDGLFRRDPTLTVAYHHLQPQLYAVHQPAKLLDFLKISTGYGLEGALRVCEECGLLREQVYLLGRMGNSRKALGLIINKLENVDMVGWRRVRKRIRDVREMMMTMHRHKLHLGHGICFGARRPRALGPTRHLLPGQTTLSAESS